jgi:hypothetical protein
VAALPRIKAREYLKDNFYELKINSNNKNMRLI